MPETAIQSYRDYNGDEIQLAKIQQFIGQTCPQATQAEVDLFIARCRASRLNPFLNEAYLVKYGERPASIIVSKDALVKRADRMDSYDGMQHGVTVLTNDGQIVDREGQAYYREIGEKLIGAWCKVYRKDRKIPVTAKVSLAEFNQKRAQWNTMPAIMIDKVAQTTALRQAFPRDFAGMYEAAEIPGERQPEQQPEQQPAKVEAVEVAVEADPRPRQSVPSLTDGERTRLAQVADAIGGDRRRVWDAYQRGGMDAVEALVAPEPEQDVIEF